MKKNKKLIIIIVAVIIVVIVAVLIFSLKKKKVSDDEMYFPLQYGDSNDYVKQAQIWLLSKGAILQSGADGVFGSETKAAVQSILETNDISYEQFKNQIAS